MALQIQHYRKEVNMMLEYMLVLMPIWSCCQKYVASDDAEPNQAPDGQSAHKTKNLEQLYMTWKMHINPSMLEEISTAKRPDYCHGLGNVPGEGGLDYLHLQGLIQTRDSKQIAYGL
ncbi:hypothetical protein VNO77_19543 [Canavalia gladiata]|uniref:Uncharacterized protein n=1 Tax=Canavalia gladiata TaxID=3824 RepID=A0AAN9LMX2_CANGL